MKKTKYEKQIDEFVKFAASHHGFVAETARQMTNLTGDTVSRQQVDGWLKSKASERNVPNANTAEVLLQAADLARKEFAK